MATHIVDTDLITSASITGGGSIPAFASSVGLPVGAVLGEFGVALSLLTIPTRKFSSSQTVKLGKHDAIMLLAQSKLDSITDIISQVMQDGNISPSEFLKVLQKREKYRKLKADIRNRAEKRPRLNRSRKNSRKKYLNKKEKKEEKKTKKIFYGKFFRYPGCQCHLKYESPPPYGM